MSLGALETSPHYFYLLKKRRKKKFHKTKIWKEFEGRILYVFLCSRWCWTTCAGQSDYSLDNRGDQLISAQEILRIHVLCPHTISPLNCLKLQIHMFVLLFLCETRKPVRVGLVLGLFRLNTYLNGLANSVLLYRLKHDRLPNAI